MVSSIHLHHPPLRSTSSGAITSHSCMCRLFSCALGPLRVTPQPSTRQLQHSITQCWWHKPGSWQTPPSANASTNASVFSQCTHQCMSLQPMHPSASSQCISHCILSVTRHARHRGQDLFPFVVFHAPVSTQAIRSSPSHPQSHTRSQAQPHRPHTDTRHSNVQHPSAILATACHPTS